MIVSIANVIVSATFLSIGVWMLRRTHASRANLAADTSTADAARRMVTVLQVCVQHNNNTNRGDVLHASTVFCVVVMTVLSRVAMRPHCEKKHSDKIF